MQSDTFLGEYRRERESTGLSVCVCERVRVYVCVCEGVRVSELCVGVVCVCDVWGEWGIRVWIRVKAGQTDGNNVVF